MSIFSNGDQPGEKEPNPKRRRTKRPGNRAGEGKGKPSNSDKSFTSAGQGNSDGRDVVPRSGYKNGSSSVARNGHGETRRVSKARAGNQTRPSQNELQKSDRLSHSNGNSETPLSGQSIRVGEGATLPGNDTIQNAEPKKRRRGKRRSNRAHSTGQTGELRHVRAMPKPAKDVQYVGPAEPKPAARHKPHHHAPKSRQRGGHVGAQHRNHSQIYAALDLGTNNCRLLLATPIDKGRFRVVDGFSRIVRLGEGLEQSGSLSQDAMDRAVEALKVCAVKLANRKIRKQRLIATEACRQALNGELFLKRVKEETGLDLEIVDRETEARLAAEGCGSLMDRKAQGAVLFDIGGGSSELILVDSSRENSRARKKKIGEQIVAWTSLPMGVVTLAERFGGRDVTRELFDEMVRDVAQHIDAFEGRHALAKAFESGNVHLLGTSGTVTTLAGIHLELPRYDRRRVDGIWLLDQDVETVINRLIDMPYSERAKNPCIGEERADLVLAGCAILNAIRQAWPTPRLRVADRGLREGLLAQMMNSDGAWSRRYRDRRLYGRRGGGNQRTENRPDKGEGKT